MTTTCTHFKLGDQVTINDNDRVRGEIVGFGHVFDRDAATWRDRIAREVVIVELSMFTAGYLHESLHVSTITADPSNLAVIHREDAT